MNHFSCLGFRVENNDDFAKLVTELAPLANVIKLDKGQYLRAIGESGAGLYIQANYKNELTGAHPAFEGASRRTVRLMHEVRDGSPMDGGWYAWADPTTEPAGADELQGAYPFVFNVPDFLAFPVNGLPKTVEIQLSAFAGPDLKVFADEQAFNESQTEEPRYSSNVFIPSGLFIDKQAHPDAQPQPYGMFAGKVLDWELRENDFMGTRYYWLLVETLGGQVDVVAPELLLPTHPNPGNIVYGQFWLSGRFVGATPQTAEEPPKKAKKGLFSRLFGR